MHITLIAGARPNFMKIAPIIRAMDVAIAEGEGLEYSLVHTGQHYDKAMSGNFFEQLGIPEPSANLECGGGSQAEQTAAIMVAFERYSVQRYKVWMLGIIGLILACREVERSFLFC
jgi:UDP-N-acetylglucosamine 2-epimerase (non-hydrolysing)